MFGYVYIGICYVLKKPSRNYQKIEKLFQILIDVINRSRNQFRERCIPTFRTVPRGVFMSSIPSSCFFDTFSNFSFLWVKGLMKFIRTTLTTLAAKTFAD